MRPICRFSPIQTLFVVVERLQECQEFLFIASQNRFDLRWLLRVCHKHLRGRILVYEGIRNSTQLAAHLEYVERFELYILTLVPQKVHHHLEVSFASNISCHNVKVCAIQKDFS